MEEARYFPDEEPGLASVLDEFLASLKEDLHRQTWVGSVRALLLAGGYGRGEGGVFRESEHSAPQLYNDLEFFVLIADHAPLAPVEAWCATHAHRGEEKTGIEVEFKLLRRSALSQGAPSMFFYDLLSANRLVFGEREFLDSLPESLRIPALIPLHEAARLLFNRGSGLFYSRVALERNDVRAGNGFIERNHAKVRLALADAVLAANGRYHFSCRERHLRITGPLPFTPPDWPTLVAWHGEGVEFKLHPRHCFPPAAELRESQGKITALWLSTFLWLESRRLGRNFSGPGEYAAFRGRLFPGMNPMRNLALHARDRIRRGGALPHWFDYPRAALQRSLVCVLQPEPDDPQAARELALRGDESIDVIHDAYLGWWKYYN
ncbi:MAG: hypothetical protein WCH43_09475 [Verrucomicrobiota bacterium]